MEATDENKNRTPGEEPSEIARLQEELRREHDMYLRALADFENYRRRVERDRSTAARSGKRDVILPLLDVLDGFDRASLHFKASVQFLIPSFMMRLDRLKAMSLNLAQ